MKAGYHIPPSGIFEQIPVRRRPVADSVAGRREVPRSREDEERLTIARQYGRYGYRKIAGLA
jgi:hypothetical protein